MSGDGFVFHSLFMNRGWLSDSTPAMSVAPVMMESTMSWTGAS